MSGPTAEPAAALARSSIRTTLVGKAVEAATLVGLVTLVPRALGPADYGVFALALSVVAIASSTVSLGGPTLTARFVPAAAPRDRGGLVVALALRLGGLRTGQVAVLTALAVLLAMTMPDRFPPVPTLLVALAVALDVAATLAFQLALGLGRTALWSARYPVQNSALIAAVLPLHALAGSTGAVAAVAVGAGAALALGIAGVVRRVELTSRSVDIPPGALRFGFLQAVSGFFVQIAHRGPVVAVVVLAGSRVEAGFAALAVGVALALTYVVWQVFTLELPRLSERAAADPAGVEVASIRLAWVAVLALVPLTLAGAVLLEPLLLLAVGDRYRGMGEALGPALAVLPFASLTALVGQVAALRMRAEARAWATGAGALAFTVAAVLAVPRWGAVGGSVALLVGTVATVVVGARLLPAVIEQPALAAAVGGAAATLVLNAVT